MTDETKENESPKITTIVKSEKVKDPKRVEAETRLAAISKEAKERKMRERISAEKGSSDGYAKSQYLIGLGSVSIRVVGLYFVHNRYYGKKIEMVTIENVNVETKEEEPKKETRNISLTKRPVFDTFNE